MSAQNTFQTIEKFEKDLFAIQNIVSKKKSRNRAVLSVPVIIGIVFLFIAGSAITGYVINDNDANNIINDSHIDEDIINIYNETKIINESTYNHTNTTTEQDIYEIYNITRPGHHKMLVLFDYKIAFLGYDINQTILRPNNTFEITYYWKALDEIDKDYMVFVHFTNKKGQNLFQGDYYPDSKTTQWKTDQIYKSTQMRKIPKDIETQEVDIRLGWYYPQTGVRLDTYTQNNRIIVGKMRVS